MCLCAQVSGSEHGGRVPESQGVCAQDCEPEQAQEHDDADWTAAATTTTTIARRSAWTGNPPRGTEAGNENLKTKDLS